MRMNCIDLLAVGDAARWGLLETTPRKCQGCRCSLRHLRAETVEAQLQLQKTRLPPGSSRFEVTALCLAWWASVVGGRVIIIIKSPLSLFSPQRLGIGVPANNFIIM